ncbi:MAG: c-type cytochrome, partial [Solirubrobacterales bacterium]
EEVFASGGCGSCHTLEEAGTSGTVGPNLDQSQIDEAGAVQQITDGGGGMPAFEGQLSEEQIQDVAAFVVESQG